MKRRNDQGNAGALGLPRMPYASDDGAIDAIPTTNEVPRSLIPTERLSYLARNPFCRRVCCDLI